MKKSETALTTTRNTAIKQVNLTKMRNAGQETESGSLIIKSAHPIIDHNRGITEAKEQAAYLKSLMRVKKPKKLYKEEMRRELNDKHDAIYYRSFWYEKPELTEDERYCINQNLRACPKETIVNLITRYLEIHKKHIVSDQDKRTMLYIDMSDMLYGLPEYALTLGIMDIINDKDQVFFPTVGKIQEHAEAHLLPWPDNFEDGEEKV